MSGPQAVITIRDFFKDTVRTTRPEWETAGNSFTRFQIEC